MKTLNFLESRGLVLLVSILAMALPRDVYAQRDLRPFFLLELESSFASFGGTIPQPLLTLRTLHPEPPTTLRRIFPSGQLEWSNNRNAKSALIASYLFDPSRIDPIGIPVVFARTPSPIANQPLSLGVRQLSAGFDKIVQPSAGLSDRYRVSAPAVRTTLDGSAYESVALTVERNGALLSQQHYGYRMGLVAARSGTEDMNSPDFEHYDLVSLPEPVADGLVTEYVLRSAVAESLWGHFFYATTEAERSLLDNAESWVRSGREFKSGGYLPVCRFFYRPPNGAPATHFYTAKADECEQFKTLAGFTYEGTAFRASLPRPVGTIYTENDPARCPEKSRPLWRVFNGNVRVNNAPNHRYVIDPREAEVMGWSLEGISLCVPQ
jgi:hypothetical protein